jgi:hypothetical protein
MQQHQQGEQQQQHEQQQQGEQQEQQHAADGGAGAGAGWGGAEKNCVWRGSDHLVRLDHTPPRYVDKVPEDYVFDFNARADVKVRRAWGAHRRRLQLGQRSPLYPNTVAPGRRARAKAVEAPDASRPARTRAPLPGPALRRPC